MTTPSTETVSTPVAIMSAIPAVTGPTMPQTGVPAPDRADQLPTVTQSRTAPLWWLGVHGGAGESTLAQVSPSWAAAGHAWPSQPYGAIARIVLVARTDFRGLRAAQVAATQWASGQTPPTDLLGLVLVADAPGRLPKPLRDLSRIVAGGVPRIWQIGWQESWRVTPPTNTDMPNDVQRLLTDLETLID